ncbi:DUF5979 domain-containing protein [Litorihabitans aurantiacus]|uniref:DUF5979 domain-containing protein n=1 Tax=Litorihabitans aurantiacus TaxID=1930061 RepID=A0AA38CRQ6_9MICO|nr:DUF5979 domain-containing protein [Litorihabitans aurantiacus]GMA32066.1 hypothetical protein GCM10025875_20580 [Litorihabitans aurantiacus]
MARTGAGLALTAAMTASLGAAVTGTAAAAPPYATEASVSDVAFTSQEVTTGTLAEIRASWSLPDDPTSPAGFTLPLPPDLTGLPDAFDVLDPAGEPMGSCDVTNQEVVCDLDPTYLAEHPRNITGTVAFWARVETRVSEATSTTFTFDDQDATVTVLPGTAFSGLGNDKFGTWEPRDGTIWWDITVRAPIEGMRGGDSVSVLEQLGPNQTVVTRDDGSPEVVVRGATLQPDGSLGPWQEVDDRVGTTLTLTDAGLLIEFTAEEGWFYNIGARSRVTDGGASDSYGNTATVTIAGQSPESVSREVRRQGGSGTGRGDRVGMFAAAKVPDGTGAGAVPSDTTFQLDYTYPAGETWPAGSGTLVLPADGTVVTSEWLPVGAELTLAEQAPPAVDGVTWGTPELSTTTLTIGASEVVRVDVTNPVTLTPPTPETPPTPQTPGVPVTETQPPPPGPTPAVAPPAVPTPSAAPGPPSVTVSTPEHRASPRPAELARTGAVGAPHALAAAGALVAGGLLLVRLRRRVAPGATHAD